MSTRSLCASLVAAACLAATGLLAGCNTGGGGGRGEAEATRRVQRGVEPGERTLVLDSYSGDVTLRDTTAQEASLAFVKHARAESQDAARELLSRIRVQERGGGSEFAYKLTSGASGRTSVDVRGTVPQRTRLRVHLRNGAVALSGLRGPLDVTSENGSVRIGGAARSVRAETRNGAVEAGVRSVPPEGEVRLRTQNGNVKLTLPADAPVDVQARTDAGAIDVGEGLRFSDREYDRSGAGARFEGELGGGTARVRLRTSNGNITLRQGSVRHLEGVGGATRPSSPDTSRRDSSIVPPLGDSTRSPARRDTARPTVLYDDTPPPLLRRPDRTEADTAAGNSSPRMPMLPPSRRDTAQ